MQNTENWWSLIRLTVRIRTEKSPGATAIVQSRAQMSILPQMYVSRILRLLLTVQAI